MPGCCARKQEFPSIACRGLEMVRAIKTVVMPRIVASVVAIRGLDGQSSFVGPVF